MCDFWSCSKRVKTVEGVRVLYKRGDIVIKDYLRDELLCYYGYVVCDDGDCLGWMNIDIDCYESKEGEDGMIAEK